MKQEEQNEVQDMMHEEKVNNENPERRKVKKDTERRKVILKNLGIALAVLIVLFAASYIFDGIKRDQNFAMKFFSKDIKLDETVAITYQSNKKNISNGSSVPVLCFKPRKSVSYTVTLSDIKSEDGIDLMLSVMDDDLTNYIGADTISAREKSKRHDADPKGVLSGSGILNRGKNYYIVVEPVESTEHEYYKGSFNITVTMTPEAEEPEEIKAGETIEISIDPGESTSVVFRPEEDGYYRFESTIKGMRAMAGSSGISSIFSDNGREIGMFGGISYLKAGNEYYVVVNTDESINKRVHTDVSCGKVEHMTKEGHGTIEINTATLIEYISPVKEIPAVWSESEGDPQSVIFDKQGIPVSNDNDSGGVFGGNSKDFALIFQAEKHKVYRIFVGGEFDVCKINIGKYIGDGTRLEPDDVYIEPEDEPQNEESEGTNDEEPQDIGQEEVGDNESDT